LILKKNQKQQQRQSSYRCFLSDLAGLACWRFTTPGPENITEGEEVATPKWDRLHDSTENLDHYFFVTKAEFLMSKGMTFATLQSAHA
jgi:hypothetical protein